MLSSFLRPLVWRRRGPTIVAAWRMERPCGRCSAMIDASHELCEHCAGVWSTQRMEEQRQQFEALIQEEMARLVNVGTLWARIRGMEGLSMDKLTLLKPHPDVCQLCAADHKPDEPHNPESLYWQVANRSEGKPPPTWEEAMAHCSTMTQDMWKEALADYGFVCPECNGWKRNTEDYICDTCRDNLDGGEAA